MNVVYLYQRMGVKTATVLRLTALAAALLFTGCESVTMPEWMPLDWPWQQNVDAAPDPDASAEQQAVDKLIAKGNLAFTKDRLSIPANDNAVMYYREALKIDPGNKEAIKGLTHVSKRFRKLARTAHDNGSDAQARKYLGLAESVSGKNDPANQKLRQKLQSTPKGQNQRALDRSIQEQYKAQKNLLEENQRSQGTQ
jgi:hypothetical protein